MANPPTVHLIDALPYVFRAYFSIPGSMVGPDGAPTGAIFGFANFLLRYVDGERPTHAAACFDESLVSSFRNESYPAYKANRELPPPELAAQLAACQEVAAALGFPCFVDERYEADDLIATLAAQLPRKTASIVVATNDKDLAQLVDERTSIFDAAKDERYDAARVRERFGVHPGQIPDYLGLAGDAVDNIPGVRGVGAKTAVALLEHYADLDELYANLDAVADLPLRGARSIATKLAEHRDLAFLSRELATVSTAAPVKAELADLALRPPDRERCRALFTSLGMKGLAKRFA